jgi:hypothetical protein
MAAKQQKNQNSEQGARSSKPLTAYCLLLTAETGLSGGRYTESPASPECLMEEVNMASYHAGTESPGPTQPQELKHKQQDYQIRLG